MVILNPNDYLFNSKADGIKNYYAYNYYIQNNHSNTSFEGLNYPYGEVIIYTDCNLPIAFCVRSLSNIFPSITNYSIGILNSLMLLSLLLTATFLYLIFKNLRVHPALSALGAFSIMVLAPQIFRMTGHYSLSFSFIIPLTMLLLIKTEQRGKTILYGGLLSLHILIAFFTHPYLGLISVAIILSYLFVKWVVSFRQRSFYGFQSITLGLSAVFPLLVFYAFTKLVDHHIGRTTNPYGFFEYYADLDTIFLPHHPPFQFLVKKFLPAFTQTWEGWSYIGIVAIGTCIITAFRLVGNLWRKRRMDLSQEEPSKQILILFFITSVLLVLFSMGLPFRILPKHYLDYFPFIKQFRSIGRFSWVFFFVINIIAIYGIDRYGKKMLASGKKGLVYAMFFIFPSIVFFEGIYYHKDMSGQVVQSKNVFLEKNIPENLKQMIASIDKNKYQAIIPLPYYNFGSENFMKETTNEVYVSSMLFSFYTQLPLISNFNARASIPESKKLMQLFGNDFYKKNIDEDIDSKLPFLMLNMKGEGKSLLEFNLYSKGKIIYSNDEFELLEISKENLFKTNVDKVFQEFEEKKEQFTSYHGFLTNDTVSYFFYNSYDSVSNGTTINFRGKGTLGFMKNDRLVLADIPAAKFGPMKSTFIASFWIYNDGVNYGQDVLTNLDFNICQTINREEKILFTTQPKTSMNINNDWSLVELLFLIESNQGNVQFVLEGKDWKNRQMYLDDFFIYQLNSSDSPKSAYYRIDGTENGVVKELFMNNHQVRR